MLKPKWSLGLVSLLCAEAVAAVRRFKVGDVIDGQWRVDRIQDRQLQLTYLPLQQTLSVAMK